MNNLAKTNPLEIDLSGIEIEDIEVFFQEGSMGIPIFAASSATCGSCCAKDACSSSVENGT